jgi:hypothetical protein
MEFCLKSEIFRDYLDSLTSWVTDKGYHVEFQKGGDTCICRVNKIIEINSSVPLERQVYLLLHECGHALIFENGSVWKYDDNRSSSSEQTDSTKVFTVIEEIEAWERAYKLAKRLNIEINDKKWNKEVADAIKKYIDWAAN